MSDAGRKLAIAGASSLAAYGLYKRATKNAKKAANEEELINKFFAGRVCLITGASMGIGEEIAIQLARIPDTKIVIAARSIDKLREVSEKCKQERASVQIQVVKCDVTDEKQCKDLVEATVRRFGCIDALFLNAGVSSSQRFDKMEDLSVFNHLMQVNFFGYVYVTKYALPYLQQRNNSNRFPRSVISVTSSMSGKLGVHYRTAYCASKHAVNGFFNVLRNELGPDSPVHITLQCPGWVDTTLRQRHVSSADTGKGIADKSKLLTPQSCVRGMLLAVARGQREELFQFKNRLCNALSTTAPEWVDEQLRKHVDTQTKGGYDVAALFKELFGLKKPKDMFSAPNHQQQQHQPQVQSRL